jgi:hypothetical protein
MYEGKRLLLEMVFKISHPEKVCESALLVASDAKLESERVTQK